MLKFARVGEHEFAPPGRAHPGDAGFDLIAVSGHKIYPEQVKKIPTGWAWAIPSDWVGMVCPRSGLAAKMGITVANSPGIVDSQYRGEVCVLLHNFGERMFTVEPGDRVAQMVLLPAGVWTGTVVERLDDTQRGVGGFGSTGR